MKRIHTISFKHAAEGVFAAIKTQPNFRVHLLATIVVVTAGYYFHLHSLEWLVLILAINTVIVAELINTAIEATVDLLTSEHHHYAKVAKDVAAAAVLVSALAAVVIGIIIFLPKIL